MCRAELVTVMKSLCFHNTVCQAATCSVLYKNNQTYKDKSHILVSQVVKGLGLAAVYLTEFAVVPFQAEEFSETVGKNAGEKISSCNKEHTDVLGYLAMSFSVPHAGSKRVILLLSLMVRANLSWRTALGPLFFSGQKNS